MAGNDGGVRALWVDGGPMVVISSIGDATVSEVEEAVMGVVNDVIALAEGLEVPDDVAAPPAAPPAAPAAPVAPAPR